MRKLAKQAPSHPLPPRFSAPQILLDVSPIRDIFLKTRFWEKCKEVYGQGLPST